MPRLEIMELLPVGSAGWGDADFEELRHVAKRQRRKLDLEDNNFLVHQKLLYKDKAFIDRRIWDVPLMQANGGASLEKSRSILPKVFWKTRVVRLVHAPRTISARRWRRRRGSSEWTSWSGCSRTS